MVVVVPLDQIKIIIHRVVCDQRVRGFECVDHTLDVEGKLNNIPVSLPKHVMFLFLQAHHTVAAKRKERRPIKPFLSKS